MFMAGAELKLVAMVSHASDFNAAHWRGLALCFTAVGRFLVVNLQNDTFVSCMSTVKPTRHQSAP